MRTVVAKLILEIKPKCNERVNANTNREGEEGDGDPKLKYYVCNADETLAKTDGPKKKKSK